ncbi:hypothetical protein [Steroidobacter cummioxidans]|uniref:hypothetical protein n=1 Tax=Steroidobacter cummioxidans TaxID=1803913 RepID=UPI0012905430|nr:hypothetical protein [Steroidobacter cummioxidans]
MKIDWVAEGFAAMRDCGEDISIVYGRVNKGPRAEPEWAELPHDKFDGIGGFGHLLREHGCPVDELPVLNADSLTFSRAVRGLVAVSPALKVRTQQWRNFDATRSATFRPVAQRVAWKLLTEDETKSIVAAAKATGVTVNTLLLFHLDRAVSAQLTPELADRLWMIPVNLRGGLPRQHPEAFLKMSFFPVDLQGRPSVGQVQARITSLKDRHCHWGSWAALHLGKLIGAAGIRRELRKRDKQNNSWTGLFSNLGVWTVPGAGHWVFGPAVSRAQPIGAGCLTLNGCMALTVQLHEALSDNLQDTHDLLDAWTEPFIQATPASVDRSGLERFGERISA